MIVSKSKPEKRSVLVNQQKEINVYYKKLRMIFVRT